MLKIPADTPDIFTYPSYIADHHNQWPLLLLLILYMAAGRDAGLLTSDA